MTSKPVTATEARDLHIRLCAIRQNPDWKTEKMIEEIQLALDKAYGRGQSDGR